MSIRPIFAWYDIWVGVFIDRPKRRLYVFPVPCFGIVVEWATDDITAAAEEPATS